MHARDCGVMAPLSHLIPDRSIVGWFISAAVSAVVAELTRTYPRRDFEGQWLLAFGEGIIDDWDCSFVVRVIAAPTPLLVQVVVLIARAWWVSLVGRSRRGRQHILGRLRCAVRVQEEGIPLHTFKVDEIAFAFVCGDRLFSRL